MDDTKIVELLRSRPDLLTGGLQREEDIHALAERYPGAGQSPLVQAMASLPLAGSNWDVRVPLYGQQNYLIELVWLSASQIVEELDSDFPGRRLRHHKLMPISIDATGSGDCIWIEWDCSPESMLYLYYHDVFGCQYEIVPQSVEKICTLSQFIDRAVGVRA